MSSHIDEYYEYYNIKKQIYFLFREFTFGNLTTVPLFEIITLSIIYFFIKFDTISNHIFLYSIVVFTYISLIFYIQKIMIIDFNNRESGQVFLINIINLCGRNRVDKKRKKIT